MGKSADTGGIGAGLTARIGEQVLRAKVAGAERLGPHFVRYAMAAQEEFFRLTGAEMKATLGPMWTMIADHPDTSGWAAATANFLGRGHGQFQTLLAGSAVGAAMGGGIMDLIRNEMAPPIYQAIGANPHLVLSPAEAAAAEVRGLGAGIRWSDEAAANGINGERFVVLRDLNTVRLAPAEVVELYRRGELDQASAVRFLRLVGMDADTAKRLLSLGRVFVTLADAGQMWNRSIITTDELVALAKVQGFTEVDAHRFAELGGMPPSPETLYTAFRRGFIDADRLRRGIVQGPIRNEWFDVLEKMQYRSMSPEEAASAVTQGHMDIGRGREIAKEYGLNPDDFATIVETSGRPPGIDFAAEAFRRGFITDDQWASMFLESAIKNRYLPILRQMRTELVPQETARMLLTRGIATPEWTANNLMEHGFSAPDAAMLVQAATQERTDITRTLSITSLRELYLDQEITPEQALEMFVALGFDEQEAQWEIAIADMSRTRTYRNAVVGRVRAAFVKGFVDDQGASVTLDALKMPAAARDTLIDLWTIERTTVTRDLTPAQIIQAAKKQLMPYDVALNRLVGQGYDQGDAAVLLAISGQTPPQ